MADTYEQNLGQKSSLTASDFIRVVGSDNVSYKQSIPSVLVTMGLSLYYTDTNSTSDGSTDDARYKASVQRALTTFSNSNPTVNRAYPIMIVTSGSLAGTFVGVVNVTSTAMRFFLSYADFNYSGQFLRSSNTVNVFQRIPTRAEIDALNSNTAHIGKVVLAKELNQNTSASVSLKSGNVYLVVGVHPYTAGCAYAVAGWGGGAARVTPILTNSNVALTMDSLTLTISMASATMWIRVLDLGYAF